MNPELFHKYGIAHHPHVAASYDKLFELLRWNENEKIMDIGCGSANVLLNILLPRLPKSVSHIVGSDISENMIQYCESLPTIEKISFIELDIETENLSIELEGQFQHLFSTYSIMYWKNLSRGLMNCFKLAKPGGQLFFVFTTYSYLHQMYKRMSMSEVAEHFPFLKKYHNYEEPFEIEPDHETAVKEHFRNVGFDVEYCEVIEKYMEYPSANCLLDVMQALDLEMKNIPESEVEKYREVFLHAMMTDPRATTIVNEHGDTIFRYFASFRYLFVSESDFVTRPGGRKDLKGGATAAFASTSRLHIYPEHDGDDKENIDVSAPKSRGLMNCFKLTKPGGQLCFVFTTYSYLHQMYKRMSMSKMAEHFPFLKKYHNYEEPFEIEPDLETAVKEHFRNVGFDVEYCEVIAKYIEYSSPNCLLDVMQALDLEMKNIPESEVEKYREVFLHAMMTDPRATTIVNEHGDTIFRVILPVASIVARRPMS